MNEHSFKRDPYEEEAREKWGSSAVDWAQRAVQGREEDVKEEMQRIFQTYATLTDERPTSEPVQRVTHEWYTLLNTLGDYPLDTFRALGQLYVQDERFRQNLERVGPGVAQCMCDAMQLYDPIAHSKK